MLLPALHPGIAQCHPLPRHGVFPVNMRPCAGVTMRARQRHSGHCRLATTGPRQTMVDRKATDLEVGRYLTVFTAVTSTPHYRVPEWVAWRTHASGSTPGRAVRRRSKATWASSFSIVRWWAKCTSISNSSCSSSLRNSFRALLGRQAVSTGVALRQRVQQCLRLLQVGSVKAFGEPVVDWRQQRMCFGALALLLPEAAEAHGGP